MRFVKSLRDALGISLVMHADFSVLTLPHRTQRFSATLLILVFSATATATATADRSEPTVTVYTDVTLIDGIRDAPVDHVSVVVVGRQITDVSTGPANPSNWPPGARVVDLSSGSYFMTPGFIGRPRSLPRHRSGAACARVWRHNRTFARRLAVQARGDARPRFTRTDRISGDRGVGKSYPGSHARGNDLLGSRIG